MSSYVVITDDPVQLKRLAGSPGDWRQMEFGSAAEALEWERSREAEGSLALESQGWRFGCAFTML